MDVLGILVWLSGAGVSAVSAFVLERMAGFQNLSPNGKQTIAMVVAILIGVAAMGAHDWLSANQDKLIEAEPYIQLVIAGASILIQQVSHGIQRSTGSNG
jgi:hypothetical protein